MPDPLNRKPWPMKWVALAIVLCIGPYTWVTLHYRKPKDQTFNPYEDMKQRANVMRLLDAGYQRINATAERPAEPQQIVRAMNALASISDAPAGLSESLDVTLVEIPQLPLSFSSVSAPRETASLLPYPIVITCTLGDQKHQLGGAQVFVRGLSVVIVAQFEPLDGELTARSKESPVLITLPGGTLKVGEYTVLLAGSEQSRQWTLTVR
ncbi:hypothetical protein [Rariglobus hedericola]|uniref:Uncharacterized protein n=1 Tax=Rariglobus hedericola TaxID=2597822 RepID=A0A556QP21_9BACT|nr:hypothetical protein [Rariglobus hedericola]TSJ78396.1 hypothetical protein FPL22_03585 [Rariglobus hedericola]